MRASAESSTKKMVRANCGGTGVTCVGDSSPKVSCRICSTSRIETSLPSGSSVIAVMRWVLESIGCGVFTCSQSTRTMRSTSATWNAWMWLLNSVMMSLVSGPEIVSPTNADRLITGMMLPRSEMMPSTPCGMFGARVISGASQTSRTLNTLMPKVSRPPSLNSSSSILLEPASLVFWSTRLRSALS